MLSVADGKVRFGMQALTLTTVLFVGGESRRMGADKATLMIAGKPLWMRQLEILRSMVPDRLLISARTRPIWTPEDIDVVLDEPPSRGPLSGLVAALQVIKTTHLLALAIDMTEMITDHLMMLWNLASENMGVAPLSGKFYEPLCAIYPATATLSAGRALASGQLSLQTLVDDLVGQNSVRTFPVGETYKFLYRNRNSPEDMN